MSTRRSVTICYTLTLASRYEAVYYSTCSESLETTMEFIEGKWYCVGWEQDDGSMQWDQFIKYEGDGCFSGDDGEPVDRLYDCSLQCYVGVTGADAYQLQA